MGRPWQLVHAEISQRPSVRSAVQKHLLDHLRDIVVESVWWRGDVVFHADRFGGARRLESWGSWRRYFVCPKTGLLRVAPRARPALNELDPEGLLGTGVPLDEYDSEIDDFVTAITDDIPITEGRMRQIWDRWFEPARRDRPRLADLAARLASIQRVWRGKS